MKKQCQSKRSFFFGACLLRKKNFARFLIKFAGFFLFSRRWLQSTERYKTNLLSLAFNQSLPIPRNAAQPPPPAGLQATVRRSLATPRRRFG